MLILIVCNHCWAPCGIILGSFGDHFGVVLESVWHRGTPTIWTGVRYPWAFCHLDFLLLLHEFLWNPLQTLLLLDRHLNHDCFFLLSMGPRNPNYILAFPGRQCSYARVLLSSSHTPIIVSTLLNTWNSEFWRTMDDIQLLELRRCRPSSSIDSETESTWSFLLPYQFQK